MQNLTDWEVSIPLDTGYYLNIITAAYSKFEAIQNVQNILYGIVYEKDGESILSDPHDWMISQYVGGLNPR